MSKLELFTLRLFQSVNYLDCLNLQSKILIVGSFFIRIFFQIFTLPIEYNFSSQSIRNQILSMKQKFLLSQDSTITTLLFTSSAILLIAVFLGIGLFMNKLRQKSKGFQILIRYLTLIVISMPNYFIALQIIFIKKLINQNQLYFLPIPMIVVAILSVICLVLEKLMFSYSFSKQSGVSRNYTNIFVVKFIVTLLLLVIGSLISTQSFISVMGLNICFLIMGVYQLYNFVHNTIYYSEFTSSIYLSVIIINISFPFFIVLQRSLDIFRENFIITLFCFIFFFYLGFFRYDAYYNQQILFTEIRLIKTEQEAFKYVRSIYSLITNYLNDRQSMILAVFVMRHLQGCTKVQCFCKKIPKSKQKFKNKNKSRLKSEMDDQTISATKTLYKDKQFLKKFAEDQIFELAKNIDSRSLYFMAMFFKIEIIGFLTKFHSDPQLRYSYSINEKYVLYCLKNIFKENLQFFNNAGNIVKMEQLLVTENRLYNLKQKIELLLTNFIIRWRKMKKTVCSLNQISTNMENSIDLVNDIERIWNEFQKNNSFNAEVIELFTYYYKNIVYFNCNLKKVRRIFGKLQLKRNYQQIINLNNLNQFVFHPQTCVIESPVIPGSMGIIKNISKNCKQILGYQAQLLVNKSINRFMPRVLAKEHQQIMNRWVQNSSKALLNKLKDSFCITAEGQCFLAHLYLSVICKKNQLIIIVAILRRNSRDYILMSEDMQTIGIGSKYSDFFSEYQNKQCFKTFCPQIEQILTNHKGNEPTKKTITLRIKNYNLKTNPEGETYNPLNIIKILQENVYELQIQYSCEFMGYIMFYAIKINNIIVIKSNSQFSKNTTNNKLKTLKNIVEIKNQILKTQLQIKSHSQSSNKSRMKNQINQNQSHTSSAVSAQYFNHQFIQKMLDVLRKPQKFQAFKKTVLVLLLIFLSILILSLQYSRKKNIQSNLSAFNDALFSDGAVSDNLQLMEILFNRIMIIHQYRNDTNKDHLKVIVRETQKISKVFYDLFNFDVEHIIKNKSRSFSNNFYFYVYLRYPVKLKSQLHEVEVETLQFMEYYYYLVMQIVQRQKKEEFNAQTDDMLNLLQQNWETMKQINHYNIQFYKQLAEYQLYTLNIDTSVYLLIFIVLVSIYMSLSYCFLNENKQKKKAFLKINELVPINSIQAYQKYYTQSLEDLNKLKNVKRVENYSKTTKKATNTIFTYSESRKLVFYILIIYVSLSIVFGLLYKKSQEIKTPCQKMSQNINLLMESENYLLEAYFQLKSKYLFEYPSTPQSMKTFQSFLKNNELHFNKISIQLIQLFEKNDKLYPQQFQRLLIEDICLIIKEIFSENQSVQCQASSNFQLITQGILVSMNFFQKNVIQAMLKLKNNNTNAELLFKTRQYQDIDTYLFFMFRVYQATQSRMLQGLNMAVNNLVNISNIQFICFSIIVSLSIVFWIVKMRYSRHQLLNIYAQILFYPPMLLKECKIVSSKLQKECNL